MRLLFTALTTGLLVAALGAFVDAQNTPQPATGTPPRDAKIAPVGSGVIRGRVVAADSGVPLSRARVKLTEAETREPFVTATDSEGRYEFTKLRPGRYSLQASKRSYVTLQYGQRRAFEAGRTIELADRSRLEKVDVALPRGSVISGTLVDDAGEPMVLACVMAWRSTFQLGRRMLAPVGEWVETNDLGQYRLFGLEPGTYFVKTCRAPRVSSFEDDFAPAYYPGTVNPGEAQPVVVQLAQERAGIDFSQPPVRLARVSGVVLDSAGRPFSGAGVQIVRTGNDGTALRTGVNADGSFAVDGVVPGDYMVGAVQSGPASGDRRTTQYPVTVPPEGRTGLVLPMLEGCQLKGRVVTEEGTTPPFSSAGLRISAVSVASDLPLTQQENNWLGATVKSDWTFEMNGMGGSFLFRIPNMPVGYMVKSVLLDGRDYADKPLDIKGTDAVTGLRLVLTSSVTEVTGTALDRAGHNSSDFTVVVFSEDGALWRYPTRFVATARPDQQGRFKVRYLPPGRYLAIALEYMETGQEQDADYLESLRSKATAFTLSWGESKTLELRTNTQAD